MVMLLAAETECSVMMALSVLNDRKWTGTMVTIAGQILTL